MSFQDEDLTDDDLRFLNDWERLGKSDTADAEYKPEGEFEDASEGQGHADVEVTSEDGTEKSEQAEFDPDADGNEDGNGEEGERIDESKMDLSDTESSDDGMDGGDGEQDSDEPTGEGEDHGDEPDFDGEDDLTDEDELDEPELSDSDLESEPDHLEGGDTPDDYEPPENEQELEYDDTSEDKVEEDDGEGERANSDEARESDEPIGGSDSEDEAEDVPETDAEDNHQLDLEAEDARNEGNPEPKADAENESDELDAQQELEDHLKDSKPDDEQKGNSEKPEAESDEESSGSDGKDEPESSQEAEQPTEDGQEPQERPEGNFEGLPNADHKCENHCEDNATEDNEDKPECEHCAERIERERELWGAIATDRHDNEILPGDKLRVCLPMPFTTGGAVLTANVPNMQVDPVRVAESTAGEQNPDVCWLSGSAISSFTGWHMIENGPIWTFKKGKKLRFVEKIGEPARGRTGSNDLDGDQLDLEEEIEKFKDEMDQELGGGEDEPEESEPEAEIDEGIDPEDEEDEPDDPEDLDEHRKRKSKEDLTATQRKRFDNLIERIEKKIRQTFGGTLEYIHVEDIQDHGSYVQAAVKVISRGMVFGFGFTARRFDDDLDAADLEGTDDEAA